MNSQITTERTGTGAGDAPAWLTLEDGEAILWQGGPRVQTIIPTVVVGMAMALLGLIVLSGLLSLSDSVTWPAPALAVPVLLVGLLTAGWPYLQVRNVDYVVTDRGLYRKRGVLSRTVTVVGYETVQNVTYSQGVTATLFGYGTLAFDTAGGNETELSFRDIDEPGVVQQLVSAQLVRVWQDAPSEAGLPGTTAQWEAILDEVGAIRRAVDASRRR